MENEFLNFLKYFQNFTDENVSKKESRLYLKLSESLEKYFPAYSGKRRSKCKIKVQVFI